MHRDQRFTGHIAGVGTASGLRLVLGAWHTTPHGPFADVMLAHPDGTRQLLAPDPWVRDFVSATYTFDDARVLPVRLARTGTGRASRWEVSAGPLEWNFAVGARDPLGLLLRAVPGPVGRSRSFAGNGRTEWYAAADLHRIADSRVRWRGRDAGPLAPVDPAPQFGFGSTPRTPCLTALTSTVRLPAGG